MENEKNPENVEETAEVLAKTATAISGNKENAAWIAAEPETADLMGEKIIPTAENAPVPQVLRCHNCQSELLPDQNFCQECGAPVLREVSPAHDGIAEYNNILEKKKKKKGALKIVIIISAAVLALLIIAGAVFGYISYINKLKAQVLDLANDAEKYVEALEVTQTDLSGVNEAWDIVEDGSWMYRTTLKNYARNLFSTSISDAKTANTNINSLYSKIDNFDVEDEYADKLKARAKEVQDAYTVVYDSIIVNENGGNSSALTNLENKIAALEDVISEIRTEYSKYSAEK